MSLTQSEAAIHRELSHRTLPCGCRVEDYKTSRGATVIMIDDVGPDCHAPRHHVHCVLSMIGVIDGEADADKEPGGSYACG